MASSGASNVCSVLSVCVSKRVTECLYLPISLSIQLGSLWNFKLKLLGYQLAIPTCKINLGYPQIATPCLIVAILVSSLYLCKFNSDFYETLTLFPGGYCVPCTPGGGGPWMPPPRKGTSDCWNFTKLSAYDYIGLLIWKLMFVGVHMHACMHSEWKHACNVHATKGPLENVLLIFRSSWNFQHMIKLISKHENYCLLVCTCMHACTVSEKHACNVHATRGTPENVLLIVGSSWNFQHMIILIS